jgi:hypothetical protein
MPGGAKVGHKKVGGRVRGTPNRKTEALRQALQNYGCRIEEQIAGLLLDAEMDQSLKVDLVVKLLPYLYPQLRPVDETTMLTPQQAAGMLGSQATKFREALTRYVSDRTIVSQVLDDLHTHQAHANGTSAPVV